MLVQVRPQVRDPADELDPGSALDGLRFIVSRPIVLGAISLDLFAVLFGGANALLPIYADQILHAGPIGFGMLRSASGLGASVMAIALSKWTPHRHVGRTLLLNVAAFGCAMLVFAFSRNLWLSIAALALSGAFDMVSVVIRRGLVTLNTPDAMRGRVNAVESVFIRRIGTNWVRSSPEPVAQFLGPVASVATRRRLANAARDLSARGQLGFPAPAAEATGLPTTRCPSSCLCNGTAKFSRRLCMPATKVARLRPALKGVPRERRAYYMRRMDAVSALLRAAIRIAGASAAIVAYDDDHRPVAFTGCSQGAAANALRDGGTGAYIVTGATPVTPMTLVLPRAAAAADCRRRDARHARERTPGHAVLESAAVYGTAS